MTALTAMEELAVICATTAATRSMRDAPPAVRLAAVASGVMDEFAQLGRDNAARLVRDIRASRDYSVETHGETDEEVAAWVLARIAHRAATAAGRTP